MQKIWSGRTSGAIDKIADDFNSSIYFDSRMFRQDISGSIAHTAMLAKQEIITPEEARQITEGLSGILDDFESGALDIDPSAEDIHTFVETVLTERIGDAGKRLHTARSRNDQVALDTRIYLRDETDEISGLLKELISVITKLAENNKNVLMPGYTHMQHAQPVFFGHHLMAYSMMFIRDTERFAQCRKRINVSPIGSCALAGTTFDTDRQYEAGLLGFDDICLNSIDGVSDRDFCIEFVCDAAMLMMHLSRFSEEVILWSTSEFGFIELSDEYSTGSSIMPQKKNPDMAELCRGKTGRVYGDLMALLTIMKGIPLSYDKDMQEDKEALFDSVDTVKMCLKVFIPMLESMKTREDKMLESAKKGFMNATDLADYLAKKGMPFRDAYKISGKMVAFCIEKGLTLENLPIEEYKRESDIFGADVYEEIDLKICAEKRISEGGTSSASIDRQIEYAREFLHEAGYDKSIH